MVPTFGSTYQISGDALELVDVASSTMRTGSEVFLCILVATIHASVAVMVHRAVSYVVLVHKIYNITFN